MLLVKREQSVLWVTLNRPEVRNALSDHLIAELLSTFQSIPDGIRAVVLTGADPAFCAGGDLEWMRRASAYTEEENFRDAYKLAQLFEAIATCKPVVIARVNGHAFGGGAGLVAACDMAIASVKALFCFSEVRLGLIPATISRHVLPKIGAGNARWLFSTAEAFAADVALRTGLVHSVAPLEELDTLVENALKIVLAAGPEAAHISKMLAQKEPMDLEKGARLLATVRATPEAQEGITAFLEKRKASFVEER